MIWLGLSLICFAYAALCLYGRHVAREYRRASEIERMLCVQLAEAREACERLKRRQQWNP